MTINQRIKREARKVIMAAARRNRARGNEGTSVWARSYGDSSQFQLVSLAVLMSPVLLIAAWVAFIVLEQLSINEQAKQGTVRMGLVEDTQRILADFVVDVAHLSAQTSELFREDTAAKTKKSEL